MEHLIFERHWQQRKGKKSKKEKIDENSGQLTSLPVYYLNGNQLQCRRLCQFKIGATMCGSQYSFLVFSYAPNIWSYDLKKKRIVIKKKSHILMDFANSVFTGA